MKSLNTYLGAFCLVFILSSYSAQADWQKCNGIDDFWIMVISASEGNMFAATLGDGIYKSIDNGGNWSKLPNSPMDSATCFFVEGTNIYAGVLSKGLLLTTDNGNSWSPRNNGLTSLNIFCIQRNGTNLFAGSLGGGVHVSADNGANWVEKSNGISHKYVYGFGFFEDKIIISSEFGMMLSTDNCENWEYVNEGMGGEVLRLIVIGTKILVGTDEGLYMSSDYGTNWSLVTDGLPEEGVLSLYKDGNNLFAGTIYGVYLSGDDGTSWKNVSKGLPDDINMVWSIALNGNSIFAGTENGIYKADINEILDVTDEVNKVFSIYPNPVESTLNLQINETNMNPTEVSIYNALGQLVYNDEIPAGSNNWTVDVESLQKGVYIVKWNDCNKTIVKI